MVELAAVIDPDVRIGVPHEYGVDSTEPFLEVIQVAIDGVFVSGRIVEVPVFHHHLRLHIAALRPLELWPRVLVAVIADPFTVLHAPTPHIGNPTRKVGLVAGSFDEVALDANGWILGRYAPTEDCGNGQAFQHRYHSLASAWGDSV